MPKKVPRQLRCPYQEVDPARGERITHAMRQRGLNYNCQLCYDLNVSESTLSRWRKGSPISLKHAVGLSSALGVTLDFLLTGTNQFATLGSQVAQFCDIYSRLNEQNRMLFLNLLRSLLLQSTNGSGLASGNSEHLQLSKQPRMAELDPHGLPSETVAPNLMQLPDPASDEAAGPPQIVDH